MHEWGLACELVRQAEGEARARQARAVCAVTARVGLLSGVEPELLARAYEVARLGTLLESTPLSVETDPITASCRSCSHEGPLEGMSLICPGCGGQDLRILGGDGIHLARIVIETE
jgi:hydrogenase nickel incorporation protein HypA/HybF